MPPFLRLRAEHLLLIPAVFAIAACEDPAAPTAASLTVEPMDTLIVAGKSVTLDVTVEDAAGEALDGAVLEWASRDAGTATVDGSGLVTGVASGETWIVARSGDAGDSVRIGVRFAVEPGGVAVRLRGEEDRTLRWQGSGVFLDLLGGDEGDATLLVGAPSGAGPAFDGLLVLLPVEPAADTLAMASPPAGAFGATDEADSPYAVLLLDEAGEPVIYASRPGSRIELTDVEPPPGPGPVEGELAGRIVMRAAAASPDGTPPADTTSADVSIYADFRTRYSHLPRGTATITVEGGPAAGTVSSRDGAALYEAGPLVFAMPAGLDAGDALPGATLGGAVAGPAAGEFTVDSIHPAVLDEPAEMPVWAPPTWDEPAAPTGDTAAVDAAFRLPVAASGSWTPTVRLPLADGTPLDALVRPYLGPALR